MEAMDPEDMPSLPFDLLADRFAQLDVDSDGRLALPEMCVALDMCTHDEVRATRSESELIGARGDRRSALQRVLEDEATAPQQLHLQLTTDYRVMLISWAQNTSVPAQVQWDSESRAAGGQYANQAQASAQTYSVTQNGMVSRQRGAEGETNEKGKEGRSTAERVACKHSDQARVCVCVCALL